LESIYAAGPAEKREAGEALLVGFIVGRGDWI
jgi:hypothetical protein